jgi:enolase
MKIKEIRAKEIIDSRGNPTLKVYLETDKGEFIAGVPAGASTGEYEAVEVRDKDRMFSKGVLKAKENVENLISPRLKGMKVKKQKEIDQILIDLDGTENKSKLGANAILGVSIAVCKAASFNFGLPLYEYISKLSGFKVGLPRPLFNVINGGSHSGGGVDFQEFMISPDNNSFHDNYFQAVEIYHKLGQFLEDKNSLWKNIGDEGGYVPELDTPEEVLNILEEIAGVDIVLDVAATEFFNGEIYQTKMGDFNAQELVNYYQKLIHKFPIIGIEDPLEENDFEGWQKITEKLDKTMIIGDDLLVTNPKRIKKAIELNSCNGMILKVNQIGTVSESLVAADLAKENDWNIVTSHRSGETIDTFIADFAAGIGSQFIKSGAPARGERVAKYNRILEIEEELNI